MLKRFLVFIIIVVISGVIFSASFYFTGNFLSEYFGKIDEDIIEEVISDTQNFTIYKDAGDGIRLIVTKLDPVVVYDPNQSKTIRDLAKENNFEVVINGGFFNAENKYAGALIIDGNVISNPAPLDKQLSHVVTFNKNTKKYNFIKTTEFKQSTEYDLAFQSGPLFIEGNEIKSEFIDNALNGNGEYQRSFLGVTSDGSVFAGITVKRYALKDLANKLLEMDTFKGKAISVINLDGGSSVALHLGENNQLNYGQFKVLPVLIGFR